MIIKTDAQQSFEALRLSAVLGLLSSSTASREQKIADKAFALLKTDSRHPSLHFKKTGAYWSVRAGLHYRALGVEVADGVLWFWIGTHSEYDALVG